MAQSTGSAGKKTKFPVQKNPLETLRDSKGNKPSNSIFDQFFGNYSSDYSANEQSGFPESLEAKPKKPAQRKEFSLFSYQEYYERELVKKQIKELTEQVKKEIDLLKKAQSSFLSEVKDIEKISLEQLPEKPGVYHLRFLEIVLSLLRSLRAKIGESKTWMSAMVSKRKKRGSLFAALSKKKGTQYSLSQELQTARSIQ